MMEQGLQITSESKEVEEDKNWWKIVLLGLLGVGASVGTFHYFDDFLLHPHASSFWLFIVFFLSFLIIALLHVFLVKSFWKVFLAALLQTFVPLILFWDKFGTSDGNAIRVLLLGFIVGFYFVFLGFRRGHRMVGNVLKVRFFEISRRTLPRIVSGILLVLSVVLYLDYFSWNLVPADFGKAFASYAVASLEPLSNVITPGNTLRPDENMGDLIKNFALNKIEQSRVTITDQSGTTEVSYNNLPPAYQAEVLNSAVSQAETALRDRFSFFTSDETVAGFVYSLLGDYFGRFNALLGLYAPIILVAVIFFTLKGFFAVFYWLIELLAFLVLKILIVFGFAYANLETRTREFLLLS